MSFLIPQHLLPPHKTRLFPYTTLFRSFRLKIDPHDYETKKGHVVRFLEGGDKVKVMIMFRGREQSRPEMGDRKSTRLNSSHVAISYAVFCLKKKNKQILSREEVKLRRF